ncbi:MAG: S46 family peptidase [Planctomycetes bacterium]|nr:S46 family peptidase [Planctomycetota bacterium]
MRTVREVAAAFGSFALVAALTSAPLAALATPASADEGFWPLVPPPVAAARVAWGGEVDPALFERLSGASVRVCFVDAPPEWAASGSFVGRNGLLLTCRHVVTPLLERGGTELARLERDGHLATIPPRELAIPGLAIEWVRSVEDVTERVNGGLPRGVHASDVRLAREAARAALVAEVERQEAELAATEGTAPERDAVVLRARVVGAWGEERQLLERYERFDDVRLVFLPEQLGPHVDEIDPDPPALDVALLRVFRDGAAVRPDRWLEIANEPAREGDPVASLGHPARSSRARSAAELEFLAEVGLPLQIEWLEIATAAIAEFPCSDRSRDVRETLRRRLERDLAGVRDVGRTLQLPKTRAERSAERERLRAALATDPARLAEWEAREAALAAAFAAYAPIAAHDFWSEQLEEAADAALRRPAPATWWWRERLFGAGGTAPRRFPHWLPDALDRVRCADRLLAALLTKVRERFEGEAPLAKALAGFEPPQLTAGSLASALGRQERGARDLRYEELRRRLVPVIREQVAASEAALGACFMYADPNAEERWRFDGFGVTEPAAANGYARLSFGRIAGSEPGSDSWRLTYPDLLATLATASSDFPARWREAERIGDRFACTVQSSCDALGGCSGGALVGRDGALLGVQSSGNSHDERFDPDARSTAVDVHGLLAVLRRVYRADWLAEQLTGR